MSNFSHLRWITLNHFMVRTVLHHREAFINTSQRINKIAKVNFACSTVLL